MLQQRHAASSLEAPSPISGRSRFSKALPSVPGLLDDAPLPPMPKELPETPPAPPPPPYTKDDDTRSIKSTKSTITRKPINSSPLPPPPPPSKPETSALSTPLKSSSGSSFAPTPTGAMPMAIPRRPVGLPASPAVKSLPALALAQPSPTDSLSSLLSAYGREPEEEEEEEEAPSGGGTGASAAVGSSGNGTTYPTGQRTSPAGSQTTPAVPTTANSTPRTLPLRDQQKLPSPPPKDEKPLPIPRPASPASKPQPALPELTTPSPPRPEIWRRRPNKSDNSHELPGLTLDFSHGSTASTSTSASSEATAPTASSSSSSSLSLTSQRSQGSTETIKATPTRTPQPRSAAVGLPGRNVRPTTKQQSQDQQPQEPQEEVAGTPPTMGNGESKLKKLKDTIHPPRSSSKSSGATKNGHAAPRPGAQRPPTPEYHTEDVKVVPGVDTFVSPASPVSSSGSPQIMPADVPPATKPAVEQSQSEPLPKKTLPPSAPNLQGAASLQDLRNKSSSARSPASGKSISRRQSPTSDAGSSRGRENAEQARFPPRTSSARTDSQRPMERPRRPGTEGGDPRIVYSETQGPLYRGRDGTLYPEMKNTQDADPKAAYFPVQAEKPLSPSTIISATPLKSSHFDCYQKHRTMNRRTNRHYPLTCQACDKADAEDRWVCTFCCLRVCESCLRALNGHERVLRRLVDELATNTPLSLSSMSRPGSALGLQVAAELTARGAESK